MAAEYLRVWHWQTLTTVYDACATPIGLSYHCRTIGPVDDYGPAGVQTWEQFLAKGPPPDVEVPAAFADEIRAFAFGRKRK